MGSAIGSGGLLRVTPLTELCVPKKWEAALLACVTHVPRRPLPWITWMRGGLHVVSSPAVAGLFMFFYP